MQSKSKRISVLVPTYGRDEALVRTLKGIQETLGQRDELIVVDQIPNHTISVQDFLISLMRTPSIQVLTLSVASTTLARNVAGLQASGEILMYFDDDVDIKPGILEKHLAYYANPEVAGVAGHVLGPGERKYFCPSGQYVRSAQGCHMSFRRQAFLDVGGFDTNFVRPFSGEEQEFCERIRRICGKIANASDCVCIHRPQQVGGSGNRVTRGDDWYRGYYHNTIYWLLKRPMPYLLLQLPWHLAFMVKHGHPGSFRGLSPEFLIGVVGRAAWNAIHTRFAGRRPPFWPDSASE